VSDINKTILMGRLTKDPELKFTPNNTEVCNFSLASNEKWKDANGETKEKTLFLNCVAWKGLAKVISEYCKKGNRLLVEGKLNSKTWEDSSGNKKSTIELNVENFQLIDRNDLGDGGL